MDAIRKIRLGDEELRIFVDDSPDSPRNWDNLGHMVCFNKRYELGDKTDLKKSDFASWDELEAYLYKKKKAVIVLPLYLYDHSVLRMKVGDFYGLLPQGHARFDSGQVGFIYATGEEIRKEYNRKRISKRVLKDVEALLKNEVATYDQYLRGDIYGFMLVKFIKCLDCETEEEEDVDSCWGFYGGSFEENGMLGHLDKKWREALGESVHE